MIIDDGSHKQSHMIKSFEFFKSTMPQNSIYLIEDTHTFQMQGSMDSPVNIYDYFAPITSSLSAGYEGANVKMTTSFIHSVSFYDSVIAIEFKEPQVRQAIQAGNSTTGVINILRGPGTI